MTAATTRASPTNDELPEKLPMAALLALAMTGFICIATETLPAGLLPQLAADLNISQSLGGQLVTAYAIGSLVAAIPLTIATQGWRRRNVLLLTIGGFLIFNTATALSSHIVVTLIARFLAGMAAGLAWSLLAGYARRMVPPHLQGRAMAVAMVGTPVALSLGVPLGTWLGTTVGWRLAFALMSVMSVALIAWVIAKVPDYPGQAATARMPLRRVLVTPGVRSVLAVVITWMLAHNILYTYVAPFVVPAGLATRVDLVLLVFGLAALIGIAVTGQLVDRFLRRTVQISLVAFALATLGLIVWQGDALATLVAIAIWGLTFGGAATLLQTALADTAGDGADVALSMNVVAWNGAIAGAGVIGGGLLDRWGAASFPWAMLVLLGAALTIVQFARHSGFTSGRRSVTTPVTGH